MSTDLYRLLAGSAGLMASLTALALAGVALLKRPESASLFVEDQFGFYIVKALAALAFAIVGIGGFWQAMDYLLR